MPQSQDESLISFADPMEKGLDALAQRFPDPLLFLERVRDSRAEFSHRGLVRAAVSDSLGLALQTGGESSEAVHLSGPSPERIGDAAGFLLRGGAPPAVSPEGGAVEPDGAPAEAGPEVRRLLSRIPLGLDGARVRVRGRLIRYRQEVRIAGTASGQFTEVRQGGRIRLEIELHRNGRTGTAVTDLVFRSGREPDTNSLVRRTLNRAAIRLDARPAPRGATELILAPGVGGVLAHEMFGHALESGGRTSGASALVREGAGPRSREIRIIDDPRRGRVPWRRDDEGELSRPISLVADGRLTGTLHSRTTSRRAGGRSTGHARRSSYLHPALPRMGCTFIAAGPHEASRLLEETEDGIYIRRMAAASVDPASGEAMFRVTDADRIESGRIGPPLEPFVLFVTLADTLATLGHPCKDLQFDTCVGTCLKEHQPLAVSVGAPTVRLGVGTVLL